MCGGVTGEWRSDAVWRAIISSSSLGMTQIEGTRPAAEILGPPRKLASSSSVTRSRVASVTELIR